MTSQLTNSITGNDFNPSDYTMASATYLHYFVREKRLSRIYDNLTVKESFWKFFEKI